MYSASDLRKGLKVEIDGAPYAITDFNFVKPGKGRALYNCKLKNMLNGSTLTRTFRSNDKIDKPELDQRKFTYSYTDGTDYVFMDEEYQQVTIGPDVLGDSRFFLTEDLPVDILFHNGVAVEVTLPNFVEKEIIDTEPGARGNTATNVLKPAIIEGGYQISVGLFINKGDIVRIDTRTGAYVDRVGRAPGS
jgi:elongation factor P